MQERRYFSDASFARFPTNEDLIRQRLRHDHSQFSLAYSFILSGKIGRSAPASRLMSIQMAFACLAGVSR